MKLIPLILLAFTASAHAAKGYLLEYELTYKRAGRNVNTASKLIIDSEVKDYTVVTPAIEGILMLAKVRPEADGTYRVDNMILNVNKAPVEQSTMSLRVLPNEPSSIASGSHETGELVEVKTKLTPTEYKKTAN